MTTRSGTFSSVDTAYSPAGNVWADNDNFLVRGLEGESKRSVLTGVSYLTQGYFALYLALDKPFVPTFGVGNSFFLVRQAARIPGLEDLDQQPYPMRIEENGWDAYAFWSTIYPWIASDVSFPGTLVVVFLIGRPFCALLAGYFEWRESICNCNVCSVPDNAVFKQRQQSMFTGGRGLLGVLESVDPVAHNQTKSGQRHPQTAAMGLIEERNSGTGIALAFVGLVVPDRPHISVCGVQPRRKHVPDEPAHRHRICRHPGIDSHFANSR